MPADYFPYMEETLLDIELIVNLSSFVVLELSGLVLLWTTIQILNKNPDREYYEITFIVGLLSAGIGSILAGIFRLPYIIDPNNPNLDIWLNGSYVYYLLSGLALTFLLASGLAIYSGKKGFKWGFLGLFAVIPLTYAYYFSPIFNGVIVEAEPGKANTEMTLLGMALVFGVLAILVLAGVVIYFLIWWETKNFGTQMMFYGMILFLLASFIGGFSDIIGELGRLTDPIGYFFILFGLLTIAYGFYTNLRASTEA